MTACCSVKVLKIFFLLLFYFFFLSLRLPAGQPVVLLGLCSQDVSDCVIHSDNYTAPPAASPLPVAPERRLHSKVKLFCAASKAPLSRCVRKPCSPAAHLIRRLPPSSSPALCDCSSLSVVAATSLSSWFFLQLLVQRGGR